MSARTGGAARALKLGRSKDLQREFFIEHQVQEDHPNVRSSQALLEAAGEQVKQAKSNFYPSLGVEAQVNEERDR